MVKIKNKQDKYEKRKIYILLLLAAIICFSSLYLAFTKPLEIQYLDVKLSIGDSAGLIAESNLNFGRIMPGNAVSKIVNIENSYEFPIIVNVKVSKEISSFVTSASGFILKPGEKKAVSVTAFIPLNSEFGDYEGELEFEFREA